MYKFICLFLSVGIISFSQNNLSKPGAFKGDHFVIYNRCKTAVLFCESTQQDYMFCGASKNCQGLYVIPGDTFFLNYEDKFQLMTIAADISFQNYLPPVFNYTFLPVTNCIPPQPLQLVIPINAVPGSSFQVNAQSPGYVPAENFLPNVPLPIYIYVGGQQPNNTTALSGFTTCPVTEEADTSSTGVSVKELMNGNNLKVYPNPAKDILNFEANALFNNQTLSVKITDVIGREIMLSDYKTQLDISHLQKGIYFLSLYQNGSLLSTKKVMKE